MADDDPREHLVDALVRRAQEAGCDGRTVQVLVLTTRGLIAGLGEQEWTQAFRDACEGVRAGARDLAALGLSQSPEPRIRQVFTTLGQVEGVLEYWNSARRDLLRLGLWPWPAPSNGPASPLQDARNGPAEQAEEQDLRRLLEGLGD